MNIRAIQQWLEEHNITEVEGLIPDMSGVARGKIMPASKFCKEEGMRLPESVFLQTVTGEYPEEDSAIHPAEIDMVARPDPDTMRMVPWATEPTAQVIHDCFYQDGSPVEICAALRAAARARSLRGSAAGSRSSRRSWSSFWSRPIPIPTIPSSRPSVAPGALRRCARPTASTR